LLIELDVVAVVSSRAPEAGNSVASRAPPRIVEVGRILLK
jgi:hypothetical protein